LEPGQQFEQEHSGCVGDDLNFRKTIVQRVTVVKLGVYNGDGNCFGGVKAKVGTDTAESTDVMIAGSRQCRDLIGKGKMFVIYEAKVAIEQIELCLLKSKSCESLRAAVKVLLEVTRF